MEQYHDRQLLFCEHQEIIHLIDLSKNNLKCGEISPHRLPDNSKWKKICIFTPIAYYTQKLIQEDQDLKIKTKIIDFLE